MSISVWWTGKTNSDYLKKGIDDYLKRIRHFDKLELKELKEIKGLQNAQQIISLEEKELKVQLSKSNYYVILLDERGSNYTSIEFAKWMENKVINSNNKLCFIIGGAYGFSPEFKKQANELLSFSKMTLSHQLIRLIFMEQIYRAYSIINHLPYHHE